MLAIDVVAVMTERDVVCADLGAALWQSSIVSGSISGMVGEVAEVLLEDSDAEFLFMPAFDGFEDAMVSIHPNRWFHVFEGRTEPARLFGLP